MTRKLIPARMRVTDAPRRSLSSLLALTLLASCLVIASSPLTALAAGNVTGFVFRDYNADGVDAGATEPSVGAITVTAYNTAGTVVASTTTSATTGAYTLNLAAVANGTPLRIEFTGIPSYLKPGPFTAATGTTVRFLTTSALGTANVNLALNNPSEYTTPDARLMTPCYLYGPRQVQGSSVVLPSFPYTAGGNNTSTWDLPAGEVEAIGSQIGTVYGVAYRRSTNTVYTSAFVKRHTGLGPNGTGAIYATPNVTSAITSTATLFATVPGAGTDPHPTTTTADPNTGDWYYDAATYLAVGTRGLGDLELSDDETKLYTINLNDKHLWEIPIPATGTGTPVDRGLVPRPATVTAGDARPFALGFKDGILYVGAVGSAESTQSNTNLRAYVYTFDPSTNTFGTNPVIDFPLNYTRRCADGPPDCNSNVAGAAWRPWTTTVNNFATLPNQPFVTYPQPMFADIEFLNGDMVIGLRDRMGDQGGNAVGNPGNTGSSTDYYIVTAGDMLRASPNGSGGWTLESNAQGTTFGPSGGALNGQGPTSGEFYYQENHVQVGASNHDEISMGGLTQIPGLADIVSNAMDPLNTPGALFDGGLIWMSNTLGTRTRSYRLYDSNAAGAGNTFAKANGLGDVEAIMPAAPLEIGNRVWNDLDGDGVQDADELGMDGITVQLWADTNGDNVVDTQVGTATTASGGQYYFGGSGGTNMSFTSATPTMVMASVASSADDAEQAGTTVTLNSTTLDIPRTGGGTSQTIGMRFNGLTIPQGAVITSANVQFTAAADDAGNTVSAVIRAQNSDNATTFTTTASDVSNRPTTTASVAWNTIPAWVNNASGAAQLTPNFASVVQEVVNRTFWSSGNSMAVILTDSASTTRRRADSFDAGGTPPKLIVNYQQRYTLNPTVRYEVRVPTGQAALTGYTLTLPNTDATANGDSRDSDATQSGANAVYAITTGGSGNNDHTIDIGFRNIADLRVVKTVSDMAPPLGTDVTFTITITNDGPRPGTKVTVLEPLPTAYFYRSSTVSQGTFNSGTGVWDVGDLAVGASATLTVTVTVTRLGTDYLNKSYVNVAGSFDPDSTPGNTTLSEDDIGCASAVPQITTLARVDGFTATPTPKGMLLRWRTGHEVDNLGFLIYRETAAGRVTVTPSIIAGSALLAGSGIKLEAGKGYQWVDMTGGRATDAQYYLESIALDGTRETYGPAVPETVASKSSDAVSATIDELTPEIDGQAHPEWQTEWPEGTEEAAPTDKALAAAPGLQWQLAAGAAVKLSVREDGWYRVTRNDLAAAGVAVDSIDPRSFRLYGDGIEHAIQVNGEQDGRLDAGDTVEFFGRGVDTTWTDARVYWLALAGPGGKRVRTSTSRPGQATTESSPYTVQLKQRLVYFSSLRNGDKENFFGAVVTPGQPAANVVRTARPDTAAATARVEVALQGVNDQSHAVNLTLNGQPIGTMTLTGLESRNASFDVPTSLLVDGDNTVGMQSTNGPADLSLVDYVRVTYQRLPVADDGQLWTRVTSRSGATTLDGFPDATVRVFNVTDPMAPVELSGPVSESALGYSTTVATTRAANLSLYAAVDSKIKRPAAITANAPSQWNSPSNGAGVVILTHGGFRAAAEQLASLRRSEGHTVAVVDVEDVYDEFNFGAHGPQPVRDFLTRAASVWQVKPQYVVLMGDGSFDPRNYYSIYGATFQDFVPTKLVDTSLMETASDDWFVDFNNDGQPDLSIGRLPVMTAQQAATVVGKITAYATLGGGARTATIVADRNEDANFEAFGSGVSALVPSSYTKRDVFVGQLGEDEARTRILADLQSGVGLVHYAGHGSVDLWRGDILVASDAAGLTNGQSSILVVANCLNGYYQDPLLPSLGEEFVRAPHGAVAVWASAGLSGPDGQRMLFDRFYSLVFASDLTIGDAARKAKDPSLGLDVRRSWILLGDPLTRINK